MFDHEKLDVYQLELKFLGWATEFLVELSDVPSKDLLERIVARLSKLVGRFDPDLYRVREGDDALGEAEPVEDEDDDEDEYDNPGAAPHP